MPNITINHILRRNGADQERDEVAGEITLPGGVSTYRAGSFQLRTLSAIQLTPKSKGFGIIGSISSPNVYANNVILRPFFANPFQGTTGTRLVQSVRGGSTVGAGGLATGSASVFYFIAHGA